MKLKVIPIGKPKLNQFGLRLLHSVRLSLNFIVTFVSEICVGSLDEGACTRLFIVIITFTPDDTFPQPQF